MLASATEQQYNVLGRHTNNEDHIVNLSSIFLECRNIPWKCLILEQTQMMSEYSDITYNFIGTSK